MKDILQRYDIRLESKRNAVPRLIPKFHAEDEWLSTAPSLVYKKQLIEQFGLRTFQVLERWLNFLRPYFTDYPSFIIKAVRAIFQMAKRDRLFQTQTSREFQKSKTFLKKLLESDIDLTLIAFNPIQKTCPVHLFLRLALIVARHLTKNIRWSKAFFMPLEKQFTSVNISLLLDALPIEKKDKDLIEMYFSQATN